MPSSMSIDPEKSRPIVEYASRPENAGKSNRQIARELDVHESLVRRSLAAWQREEDMPTIATRPMTKAEAMQHCDKIRHGIDSVRKLVLDLHDREGWKALGYGSWGACVVAEFDQSKSSLYRQLEAGKIEREVAPEAPVGTIPEAQLRPLAKLPEGERKPAWDEAVATATNGKVTAAHVEAVVDGNSQVGNPDPPDIARQRRNGIIPEGVAVTITEPDPADEDEPGDVQRELTNEEWLDECPAREALAPACRKRFDAAALIYRHTQDSRDRLRREARPVFTAFRVPGFPDFMTSKFNWFFGIKHPRHWVVCGDCKGSGQVPLIGKCPLCHGEGFHG